MTSFELEITFKDYVEPCDFCKHGKNGENDCDNGNDVCEGFEAFLTFLEEWENSCWKSFASETEEKTIGLWVDCRIKGKISLIECGKCDLPCKQISKKARKSIHVRIK